MNRGLLAVLIAAVITGCSPDPAPSASTAGPARPTSTSAAPRAGVDQSNPRAAAESLLAAYDRGDKTVWQRLMCSELRQKVEQGRLGAFPNLKEGAGQTLVSVDERPTEALVVTQDRAAPTFDHWLFLFIKADGNWSVCKHDVDDEHSVLRPEWERGR